MGKEDEPSRNKRLDVFESPGARLARMSPLSEAEAQELASALVDSVLADDDDSSEDDD